VRVNALPGTVHRVGSIVVTLTDALPDGKVRRTQRDVYIGTGALPVREAAGREARRLVRQGMADVLRWLGQPVDTELSGEEILARWRAEQAVPDRPARRRAIPQARQAERTA
jgi:hypothetical protein